MKAHQYWFTNKMVCGMSAVPSCMPVPRTTKPFFNEYFHTISTKITYSDPVISINEFSHKQHGVWEKQSCNFTFLVQHYFFSWFSCSFYSLAIPFPPLIFFNILLPWIDSCLGHGISLSYMPIKYNTSMPGGTNQVFKALLQHQKSIILGMAEMNEGCWKWNHPGIGQFCRYGNRDRSQFPSLVLPDCPKDLQEETGDGFSLWDKSVCADLCCCNQAS